MQLPLLPTPDSWTEVDARSRGTVFLPLAVRSVLNAPASTRMPFWSINPYVGCEFGCTYCYARETHQWVSERVGGQAGRRVENGEASEARPHMLIQSPKGVANAQTSTYLDGESRLSAG